MQVRCDPKPPTATSVSPRPSLPFANRVPAAASSSLIAGKAMVSAGDFHGAKALPENLPISDPPPAPTGSPSLSCRRHVPGGVPDPLTAAPCCSRWPCRRSTLCSRRGCCHAAPPPPGRRASVGGGGAPARDALLPRLAMEQQQQLPGVHPHSVFMVKSEPAGKGL